MAECSHLIKELVPIGLTGPEDRVISGLWSGTKLLVGGNHTAIWLRKPAANTQHEQTAQIFCVVPCNAKICNL